MAYRYRYNPKTKTLTDTTTGKSIKTTNISEGIRKLSSSSTTKKTYHKTSSGSSSSSEAIRRFNRLVEKIHIQQGIPLDEARKKAELMIQNKLTEQIHLKEGVSLSEAKKKAKNILYGPEPPSTITTIKEKQPSKQEMAIEYGRQYYLTQIQTQEPQEPTTVKKIQEPKPNIKVPKTKDVFNYKIFGTINPLKRVQETHKAYSKIHGEQYAYTQLVESLQKPQDVESMKSRVRYEVGVKVGKLQNQWARSQGNIKESLKTAVQTLTLPFEIGAHAVGALASSHSRTQIETLKRIQKQRKLTPEEKEALKRAQKQAQTEQTIGELLFYGATAKLVSGAGGKAFKELSSFAQKSKWVEYPFQIGKNIGVATYWSYGIQKGVETGALTTKSAEVYKIAESKKFNKIFSRAIDNVEAKEKNIVKQMAMSNIPFTYKTFNKYDELKKEVYKLALNEGMSKEQAKKYVEALDAKFKGYAYGSVALQAISEHLTERWGQSLLSRELKNVAVTPKNFWKTIFKKTTIPFMMLGSQEAAVQITGVDILKGKLGKQTAKELALGMPLGAFTATVLGEPILGLGAPMKTGMKKGARKLLGKTLTLLGYGMDPFEPIGDYSSAIRSSIQKSLFKVKVPSLTFVPTSATSGVFSPSQTLTQSLVPSKGKGKSFVPSFTQTFTNVNIPSMIEIPSVNVFIPSETEVPSEKPGETPSEIPSEKPSETPGEVPSKQPSNVFVQTETNVPVPSETNVPTEVNIPVITPQMKMPPPFFPPLLPKLGGGKGGTGLFAKKKYVNELAVALNMFKKEMKSNIKLTKAHMKLQKKGIKKTQNLFSIPLPFGQKVSKKPKKVTAKPIFELPPIIFGFPPQQKKKRKKKRR